MGNDEPEEIGPLFLSMVSEGEGPGNTSHKADMCCVSPVISSSAGLGRSSPGGEVLKILSVGHRLNLISRIQEITLARNFCSFSSEALQSL